MPHKVIRQFGTLLALLHQTRRTPIWIFLGSMVWLVISPKFAGKVRMLLAS